MRIAVISIGRSGSSELITILNNNKFDVIKKPFNHLYPDKLLNKFGKNIKVIFITREIKNVLISIKNKETQKGVGWIKQHYINLDSDFTKYPDLFTKDTFNFEKLYDSYKKTNLFSVLFIKYENLYSKNNKNTVDMINYFLGSELKESEFNFNSNNIWSSEKKFKLSEEEKLQINKTFKSLEKKIGDYNTQLIIPSMNLINKIQLLKKNEHYRIGDVIFHNGDRWEESNREILENDYYKGTILREYIDRCPDNNFGDMNPNYKKLISDIINEKINNKGYILPLKKELVIHLRLGDVANSKNGYFLNKNYKKKIEGYKKYYKITKVTFCTAFHYGNYIEKNLWIYNDDTHRKNISGLTKLLNSLKEIPDIFIDFKSSKNPDDDFIYMIKSNFFIRDQGGFSTIIQELRGKKI